jgi:glycosyltransferase involved in cell wall biosynthesis
VAKKVARVAVFHDNFAQSGGAERVAEALHRLLPGSDLHTTLVVQERLSDYLKETPIRTSWMQYLPAKARYFRNYFLLYPFAIELVNLDGYDLVVSSCFGYAKGVKRRSQGAVHVCYCYTPMRWVWRTEDYLSRESISPWKTRVLRALLKPLKAWEIRASRRPDFYVAISQIVADRIKDVFNIEAAVIPPPVETSRFKIGDSVEDYYLVLSRLVPYKRLDLAVKACTLSGRRLIVVGGGPDRTRLEAMAGPTVEFLGRLPDEEVVEVASRCRAMIFPGEEDFGITPLEINAAGRPVIALRAGGATETVVDGVSGLFFDEPSVEALIEAMDRLEAKDWNPLLIRQHAETYDTKVFNRKIAEFLESKLPPDLDLRSIRNEAGAFASPD